MCICVFLSLLSDTRTGKRVYPANKTNTTRRVIIIIRYHLDSRLCFTTGRGTPLPRSRACAAARNASRSPPEHVPSETFITIIVAVIIGVRGKKKRNKTDDEISIVDFIFTLMV